MKWTWPLLVWACAEKDKPCAEGFGADDRGRCVPIEGFDLDTGVVINTPPTAPGIGVTPLNPRADGAPLICTIAIESVDLDGDPVVYTFTWSSGDGDSVEGPVVEGDRLDEGAVWTCTVTPFDGQENGPSSTAEVVIGLAPSPWSETQQSLATSAYLFTGEVPGDGAGAPVSAAGDVDGDGRGDFLIGAYFNDEAGNSAGKAYLIFGASLGATRHIPLSDADWHFVGANGGGEPPCGDAADEEEEILEDELCDGDWAGHSLNMAGDVDGDGLDDLLISVYRSDDVDNEAGKVLLLLGHTLDPGGGRMSLADAPIQFLGEEIYDLLGHGVASAGDMDGDGLQDIVLGAYGGEDYTGKAYVVLGSSIEDELTMDIGEADFIFEGEYPGDEAGIITSSAGDVDGDGLSDMVVTAMYNKEAGDGDTPTERSGSGKVYVVTAGELSEPGVITALADTERAWLAEGDGDALACATNAVGDVDGDGLDDVIMGAFGNDEGGNNAGKVYVATGADMASPGTRVVSAASYGFTGEGPEEWAGFSSGPAGDVDMDGKADIIIGAFRYAVRSEMKIDAGKAYLIRMGLLEGTGTYSLSDAHASWVGEAEGDEAGYRVGGIGDVNGDGLPDLAVGGWQRNLPTESGKIWVLLNP
jgi:hypothetical protein